MGNKRVMRRFHVESFLSMIKKHNTAAAMVTVVHTDETHVLWKLARRCLYAKSAEVALPADALDAVAHRAIGVWALRGVVDVLPRDDDCIKVRVNMSDRQMHELVGAHADLVAPEKGETLRPATKTATPAPYRALVRACLVEHCMTLEETVHVVSRDLGGDLIAPADVCVHHAFLEIGAELHTTTCRFFLRLLPARRCATCFEWWFRTLDCVWELRHLDAARVVDELVRRRLRDVFYKPFDEVAWAAREVEVLRTALACDRAVVTSSWDATRYGAGHHREGQVHRYLPGIAEGTVVRRVTWEGAANRRRDLAHATPSFLDVHERACAGGETVATWRRDDDGYRKYDAEDTIVLCALDTGKTTYMEVGRVANRVRRAQFTGPHADCGLTIDFVRAGVASVLPDDGFDHPFERALAHGTPYVVRTYVPPHALAHTTEYVLGRFVDDEVVERRYGCAHPTHAGERHVLRDGGRTARVEFAAYHAEHGWIVHYEGDDQDTDGPRRYDCTPERMDIELKEAYGANAAGVCAITQAWMRDPVVVVETGMSYEREAIEMWLFANDTDPRTRAALTDKRLVPNIDMRRSIDEKREVVLANKAHRMAP